MWQLLLKTKVGLMWLLLAVPLVASISSCMVYDWQEKRYGKVVAELILASDRTIAAVNYAAAEQVSKQLSLRLQAETDMSNLSTKHWKQRENDLAENKRLAGLVANKRLRVTATCPAGNNSNLPPTSGSTGVGYETSVELSGAAGRNILDAREGIIQDRAALKFFQELHSK